MHDNFDIKSHQIFRHKLTCQTNIYEKGDQNTIVIFLYMSDEV